MAAQDARDRRSPSPRSDRGWPHFAVIGIPSRADAGQGGIDVRPAEYLCLAALALLMLAK